MRGHAQQLADGDHAGAAHAGDEYAIRARKTGTAGAGRASSIAPAGASGCGLRSLPPSTVTKLGQKPFRQEKSLLQLDWLMARLRPNSVSSGSTDRQWDCSEQSPQPSHTRSLMSTRRAGSG